MEVAGTAGSPIRIVPAHVHRVEDHTQFAREFHLSCGATTGGDKSAGFCAVNLTAEHTATDAPVQLGGGAGD